MPKDGIVNYYGEILTNQEANRYFEYLMSTIEWKNDRAIIYGELIITKRKVAWYATDFEYTYSNTTKRALPYTTKLLELESIAEEKQAKNSILVCSTYTILEMKE